MAKLLILDNSELDRSSFEALLRSRGYLVQLANDGAQLLEFLSASKFDCVLFNALAGSGSASSLELLNHVKRKSPGTPVFLLIDAGNAELATAAMKAGAYDCIMQPCSFDSAAREIERSLESLLESSDPAMQRVFEHARRAAKGDAPILLIGESGAGKKFLARQIHRWSCRTVNPFIALNCEGLSEQLVERDLFGSGSGFFTGRIEYGNHGTLFLDHISKMTPKFQISLLHFIKEQRSQRISGDRYNGRDVRLIAASDTDLSSALASHQFRQDLYYRLSTIVLDVPPLREHLSDVALLAERMLATLALHHHRSRLRLSKKVVNALAGYQWPGNILELRNAIERAVVLCPDETISLEHLPNALSQHRSEAKKLVHKINSP
jgi:DNA-binding NtrC family response regulator